MGLFGKNVANVSSGSSAPTSTPSKIGDIYVDTTNKKFYKAAGTSSGADWVLQNGSYTLQVMTSASMNPVSATTYYFGNLCPDGSSLKTYFSAQRIYPQGTGTITRVNLYFSYNSLGTTEASSLYIRVNGTTDYLVTSSFVVSAVGVYVSVTGLSIPIAAGDYFYFKWITPTWVTAPIGMGVQGTVGVDL